jgi:pseudouridine-5'-phosphate glycosidase
MGDHLQRLKEELDLMSEDQPVITVSRRDLVKLIAEAEASRK